MEWLNWFVSDSNRIVATATFIVAIFAIAQFELARRTTRRQLRAYIGVSVRNSPQIKVGVIPRAILIYQNLGQTPARDTRYWADMCIEPHPSDLRFEFKPLGQERITVNPTGIENIDVWLEEPLTQPVVDMISEDKARIYVYGEVWYFDIFGSEWRTEFRLRTGGKHMMEPQGMVRCAKGNSAT